MTARSSWEVALAVVAGSFRKAASGATKSPEEALYRELKEEIGLERADVELVAGTRNWLRYRLPRQYVREQPSSVHRTETALVSVAAGRARRTRVHFDATDEPEFESWRWVDYWTPVREVIYFKRAVYARRSGSSWRNGPSRRSPGFARVVGTGKEPAQPRWRGERLRSSLKHVPGLIPRFRTASRPPVSRSRSEARSAPH